MAFDQTALRYFVDGSSTMSNSGAVETLIQLVMCLRTVFPSQTRFLRADVSRTIPNPRLTKQWIHPRYIAEYPEVTKVPMSPPHELRSGDILIVPHTTACPTRFVDRGIRVFVYVLTSDDLVESLYCEYISHGYDDTKRRVIRPYVSPSLVARALPLDMSGVRKIVLMSGKSSKTIVERVRMACDALLCDVVLVRGYRRESLPRLYRSAAVFVAWCLSGFERTAFEATIFGAALITSDCRTLTDFRDIPINKKYVLRTNESTTLKNASSFSLMEVLKECLSHYRGTLPWMAKTMRQYREQLSEHSMIADVRAAFALTASMESSGSLSPRDFQVL
eukprot:gene23-31_t